MEKIDWKKILRFLSRILFWAAIAVIPLGMSFFFPVMSPFSSVKSALLSILGSGMAILGVFIMCPWRGVQADKESIKKGAFMLAPVWAFFLCFAFLSLFSLDMAKSWFGSYERQFGLITYFWIFLWYSFAVLRFSFAGVSGWKGQVKVLAIIAAVTGTLISVYSFLQFCGYDFAVWQEPQILSRAIGTFGQPNFLGSFLVMAIPLSAYLLCSAGRRMRVWVVIPLVVQLVGLAVSGSRSAWLALAVAGCISIVISLWRKYRYKALVLAIFSAALFAFVLFLVMPERIASLKNLSQGSPALRRYFYEAGIDAVLARPLVGTGLENGGEAMIVAYRPEWGIFMVVDGYTDKAHNSALDIAIQTGVTGLILWLVLYGFVAWQVVKLFRRDEGSRFALFAGMALSAYAVSILFGLSDIPNSFFFWIITASVVAGNIVLGEKRAPSWIKGLFVSSRIGLALSVLVITFFLGQIIYTLGNLQADYYFLQLNRTMMQRDYFASAGIYSYLSESAFNPSFREHYRRQFASQLLSAYDKAEDQVSKNLIDELLVDARGQQTEQGAENVLVNAKLACFFEDESRWQLYDEAISISPRRPIAYRLRADCRSKSGDVEGALDDYSQALALLPSTGDDRLNSDHRDYIRYYAYSLEKDMAELYSSQGQLEKALASYKAALGFFPHDTSLYFSISSILEEMHKEKEAEQVLLHAHLREPNEYRWPLALAGLMQRGGDKGRAIKYAREASALAPAEAFPLSTTLQD